MATGKFVKVATTAEVPNNSVKTFDVQGEKILIANSKDRYYAIGAICKHEEWDLSEGQLEDGKVVCAGHGSIWNLKDGTAKFEEELPNEPVYEVKVEGNEIWVNPSPKSGSNS